MTNTWKLVAPVVPLALVAACTDSAKAPAEAAMAAASTAMESLKGDAAKYAPEDVKKLQSSHDVGMASVANKDYQGALTLGAGLAGAKEMYNSGDLTGAVAKAKELNAHGQEVLKALGGR